MKTLETMPDKCATCAFRLGTEASRQPLTVLKARLCAQIGEPFYCHDNAVFITPAGKTIDMSNRNRVDFIEKVPRGEYQPRPGEQWKNCAGWAELVQVLNEKNLGFKQDWQIELSARLLEVIEKAESEGGSWDEERSRREIREVIDVGLLLQ